MSNSRLEEGWHVAVCAAVATLHYLVGEELLGRAPPMPLPSTFQNPSQPGTLRGNPGKVGQAQHVRVHRASCPVLCLCP